MAYIRGFDHDVFVSYAHLDNTPVGAQSEGWVDSVVRSLQAEVRQRLGTKDFDIWKDTRIERNRPLTGEILGSVRRSALLLVVMSPGYLHSPWCARERNEFLSVVRGRVAQGSVFIMHALDVERTEIPPEFGDLLGYTFWVREQEAGAERPLSLQDDQKFMSKLYGLSAEIKSQAARLNGLASAADSVSGPSVFVARSTEDLEDREDELRAYLRQAGIGVLPQIWYPQTDQAAFEEALRKDLSRCKVFAQLLSGSRGRELPFASAARLPQLQHDIAKQSGVAVLQWRDRAIDLGPVRADHRSLLDQAQTCGIEEFKRTVVEQARREPPPAPGRRSNVMVFVNADSPDRALAMEVGEALARYGVDCYWPLESGPPDAIRSDLEENLMTCDGLLLIYGATGVNWVRRQLMQGRKILSQREHPPAGLAIVEGPPPEIKPPLGAVIPNLRTLDCRAGLDDALLSDFARRLLTPAPPTP